MTNRNKQLLTPLYDSCLKFINQGHARFYCPGHKGGKTLDPEFKNNIAELDLNNLLETDTLHCPTGPILEAESLLSEAYGTAKSFILVGGSTLGNLAALLSVVNPGDKILVQRNAHKSIIAGIILSGADPVWLIPQFDPIFKIGHGIPVANLEEAIKKHPDAKAISLLNPTYYGTVADLPELIRLARENNKILIADEAHGAHFHFHHDLPLSAVDAGADMIVQSTHKCLSALSQAAVLHLKTSLIPESKVRKNLQLLQTTSPNFAIMASIDLARREMVEKGYALLEKTLAIAAEASEKLSQIPGLALLNKSACLGKGSGFCNLDPTKLLIQTSGLGLSGYEVLSLLNKAYGIQPELAGPSYVLCILSIGTTEDDAERLVAAFQDLAAVHATSGNHSENSFDHVYKLQPLKIMTPREAFYSASIRLPCEKCIGRVCAEVVTPYPPGIPILMPGEKITLEIINMLAAVKAAGNPISCSDSLCETMEVIQ